VLYPKPSNLSSKLTLDLRKKYLKTRKALNTIRKEATPYGSVVRGGRSKEDRAVSQENVQAVYMVKIEEDPNNPNHWLLSWMVTSQLLVHGMESNYADWDMMMGFTNTLFSNDPNFNAYDVASDRIHMVAYANGVKGVNAGGDWNILDSLLTLYPGMNTNTAITTGGVSFDPGVRSGIFYHDSDEWRPRPFVGTYGRLQGGAGTEDSLQLYPPPTDWRSVRLSGRGWRECVTECLYSPWGMYGRKATQSNDRWYLDEASPDLFAPRWCQKLLGLNNTVGVFEPDAWNTDGCDPQILCNKEHNPCSTPPGSQPNYPINIFDGRTQSELESNASSRTAFWKWFLDHLGNRTGPWAPTLNDVASAHYSQGPWTHRTDKMVISFTMDAHAGSVTKITPPQDGYAWKVFNPNSIK
jgi:hypothetical protein